ncbi:hypothetical protein PGT21_031176 [Puccinia graminis f. sp. tritici]|uniref:Uncharacterized protein n=1 Tax=Puccinia graminis f. sp. tritici TaxID=56615 RepID=A0A5B0PZ95_PUCGR|nr:hypothetical protein PGT21_031176 [Puccinia graminis f. sp. tritici]
MTSSYHTTKQMTNTTKTNSPPQPNSPLNNQTTPDYSTSKQTRQQPPSNDSRPSPPAPYPHSSTSVQTSHPPTWESTRITGLINYTKLTRPSDSLAMIPG